MKVMVKGMSFVEVLIVVGIIVILFLTFLPLIQKTPMVQTRQIEKQQPVVKCLYLVESGGILLAKEGTLPGFPNEETLIAFESLGVVVFCEISSVTWQDSQHEIHVHLDHAIIESGVSATQNDLLKAGFCIFPELQT